MGSVCIQIIYYLYIFSTSGRIKAQHMAEMYHCNLGPPIIYQPKHDDKMPVRKGSRPIIHCTASGYGSLIYYWERRITENHNWFTITHSINKTSYTTGNTGQYRCNVTNEAGSVVSPVVIVYGKNLLVHVLIISLYVCMYMCCT